MRPTKAYAKRELERLGVEVLPRQTVEVRGTEGVFIVDMLITSATVIWAAGVAVPHLKYWFPLEADRTGRIVVGPDLSLLGHPEVFVIGAAAATWNDNLIAPGLARAAKQAGRYVADVLRAVALGGIGPPPFRYRHQGNLATIGRHAAIADLGGIKINGGTRVVALGARAYLLLDWCAGADACRSPMVLGLFDIRTPSPARSRSVLRKSKDAGAGERPRTLSSEARGRATSSLPSEVRPACGRPEAIMPAQLLSATTIFHER